MAPIIPTPLELRTAYRHLYRTSLEAVQYSLPARNTARDCLRAAFRTVPATTTASSPSSSSSSEFVARHVFLAPLTAYSATTSTNENTLPSETFSSQTVASLTSPVGSGATVTRPGEFDPVKIERTLEFLRTAAKRKGLAHQIVRNLLKTRYWHWVLWKARWRSGQVDLKKKAKVQGTREGTESGTVDEVTASTTESKSWRPDGAEEEEAAGARRKRQPKVAMPASALTHRRSTTTWDSEETRSGIVMFEQTVRMLNESMGMCLRV